MSYLDSQQQAATKVQLDYAASTDLASGLSLSANTWTDIGTNQTFTVDDPNSVVEIAVDAAAQFQSNLTVGATRVVIDSAGTPITKMLGQGIVQGNGQGVNPFGGSGVIPLTGLSA